MVTGSDHEIRLIDDAFGKICNGVTDLSMNVRQLAAKLLGSMTLVSPKFLCQTLDKKLMSNMRKKVSQILSKPYLSCIDTMCGWTDIDSCTFKYSTVL